MNYILNFTAPLDLDDVQYFYQTGKKSNIDFLLEDFKTGKTEWSVPKQAIPGDNVFFMCAKSARAKLGMATSSVNDEYGADFRSFVDNQKALYKKKQWVPSRLGSRSLRPVSI